MEMLIDYYVKNKEGKPNFRVHHLKIDESDIIALAQSKIWENPPMDLRNDNRELESIVIDKVTV